MAAQGNAKIPRMRHPATGDNTGAGAVPIGETVPGGTMANSKWHPTVVMLLVILAVEVAGFAALRYTFSKL